MKFKKNVLPIALSSLTLACNLSISTTFLSDQGNKITILNWIRYPEETKKSVEKLGDKKVSNIFEKLKNNSEVEDFIKKLNYDDSYSNISKKISELKLNDEESLVLTYEVLNKFILKNKRQVLRTDKTIDYGTSKSSNDYLQLSENTNVYFKGYPVMVVGLNGGYTFDSTWGTDRTYFMWDNQRVLSEVFNFASENMEEINTDIETEDLLNFDAWIEKVEERSNWIERAIKFFQKDFKKYTNSVKFVSKTKNLINYLRSLSNAKTLTEASGIVDKIGKFLEQTSKASNEILSSEVFKDIKILQDSLVDFKSEMLKNSISAIKNFISNTKWVQNTLKSLTYLSIAIEAIKFNISFIDFNKDLFAHNHLNLKDVNKMFLSTMRVLASSLLISGISFPPAQIAATLFLITDALINIIPQRNGFTIYENMHDHGLNDWEFQWKNNRKEMIKIAARKSEYFNHGIVWMVTDRWFSFPDLYIAKQMMDYPDPSKIPSKYWEWLSPGNEFNFGHKIKDIYEK